MCNATLKTEYFAEGTVPTETCNVHYSGIYCQYSLTPATESCPFKAEGVLELPLVEDISLLSGSPDAANAATDPANPSAVTPDAATAPVTTQEIVNEDGTISTVPVQQPQNLCPHTAEFMANPDIAAVLAGQQAEIDQRNAAAAAAAAAQSTDPNATAQSTDPNAAAQTPVAQPQEQAPAQ